jgi:hypothetical protein
MLNNQLEYTHTHTRNKETLSFINFFFFYVANKNYFGVLLEKKTIRESIKQNKQTHIFYLSSKFLSLSLSLSLLVSLSLVYLYLKIYNNNNNKIKAFIYKFYLFYFIS